LLLKHQHTSGCLLLKQPAPAAACWGACWLAAEPAAADAQLTQREAQQQHLHAPGKHTAQSQHSMHCSKPNVKKQAMTVNNTFELASRCSA
jgi:hypothetical protein